MSDAEGRTFIYDAENKQKEVKNASNVTVGTYFYDGDGKRVKKVTASEEIVFVYDAGGKLVAEYSSQTPQTTATTRYLTSDYLGSPRIITDQNGVVLSRRDFAPFGEELYTGTGNRTTGHGYTYGDSVRQKFTSYERDNETDLDFAEARYYNPAHGRFTAVDPLMASASAGNPQSWNRYIYVGNNPINLTDPTGMSPTDLIDDETGRRTHIVDGKDQVLVASTNQITSIVSATTEAGGRYWRELAPLENSSDSNLHLTSADFNSRVATTYGESSAFRMNAGEELGNEMKAIAYVNQRNSVAYGSDNDQAKDYFKTHISKETDKMKLANLAVANQVRGGPDPSNGATGWDGREQALFPDKDKRASVPDGHGGTWNLRKNTGGWSISDANYAKWKQNVGSAFKAPQNSTASTGRNKGQVRYYSTAVYGNTIFWRIK